MFKSVLSDRPVRVDPASDRRDVGPVATRMVPDRRLARDFVVIVATAVALRLIVMLITANTYDYDEFVLLLLAREFAHGSVPYSDFTFFHPPGALVLLRAIEPATNLWWPLARLGTAGLDVATTVLIWRLGTLLWDRRAGLAAGLLYAASPVALISSVRVGQDPLVTFAGVLGLYLLLARPSRWGAIGAGICLACAIWVKYPGAYFLPIFLLASPRRAAYVLASGAIAFVALMLPFEAYWPDIYQQTVNFQLTRWSMPLDVRMQTTLLFWLAASPLALVSLATSCWRRTQRRNPDREPSEPRTDPGKPPFTSKPMAVPAWLVLAFLIGGLFGFTSQVYYHYFAVVVPTAALLGAPAAVRLALTLGRVAGRRVTAGAVAILVLGLAAGWGQLILRGGPSPLYVTAARLSDVAPTVQRLRVDVSPSGAILADRFEYAYLAGLPAVSRYFWNVGPLVNATEVERELPATGAVVLSSGPSSGFPFGLTTYLDEHYERIDTPTTSIWLLARRKK